MVPQKSPLKYMGRLGMQGTSVIIGTRYVWNIDNKGGQAYRNVGQIKTVNELDYTQTRTQTHHILFPQMI